LLAGVSNAKLYCPVSQPVPSAHDDECHKKRGKENIQKKIRNHRSKAKVACSPAEQMKTQDA